MGDISGNQGEVRLWERGHPSEAVAVEQRTKDYSHCLSLTGRQCREIKAPPSLLSPPLYPGRGSQVR